MKVQDITDTGKGKGLSKSCLCNSFPLEDITSDGFDRSSDTDFWEYFTSTVGYSDSSKRASTFVYIWDKARDTKFHNTKEWDLPTYLMNLDTYTNGPQMEDDYKVMESIISDLTESPNSTSDYAMEETCTIYMYGYLCHTNSTCNDRYDVMFCECDMGLTGYQCSEEHPCTHAVWTECPKENRLRRCFRNCDEELCSMEYCSSCMQGWTGKLCDIQETFSTGSSVLARYIDYTETLLLINIIIYCVYFMLYMFSQSLSCHALRSKF
ncbi:uncharacterized protein LOC128555926 [Mercenaria mercenaria]|uniref:uncharacterized protein LOC128555926 n=1 Tax=Mercenaria mercenaria TaxID=6596 RepID=UPI00234E715D|nr:uncharacterized protein LOC128555926 [Mercenaria mercenaria]